MSVLSKINFIKYIFSFLLVLGLSSCGTNPGLIDSTLTSPSKDNFRYKVLDVDPKSFKIHSTSDSIFYNATSDLDFDGKTIAIDLSNIDSISAQTQFEFSLLQNLTDDVPASLPYIKKSKWVPLNINDGILQLSEFSDHSDAPEMHTLFNLKSKEDLIYWVIIEDFEEIKRISFREQFLFYTALLENPKDYEACCPSYIKQAKDFLDKELTSFKSMPELRIELYLKSRILEFKGKFKNGKGFKKVLKLNCSSTPFGRSE